jgi:hypothetical protein
LPYRIHDLAKLGRQGVLQGRQLLVYPQDLLRAVPLGRFHRDAHLRLDLLNRLLESAILGGGMIQHGFQVDRDLRVHLRDAPLHVPDVLRQAGLQGNYYLIQNTPVEALSGLHEGLAVNRLCLPILVFHFSQPFRQPVEAGRWFLPAPVGLLDKFHRHAEQKSIAKRHGEIPEEREPLRLLHL